MEEQVQFRIGNKVKIIDSSYFCDWKAHKDEIATIKEFEKTQRFPIKLLWPDNSVSRISENNIYLILGDWDD